MEPIQAKQFDIEITEAVIGRLRPPNASPLWVLADWKLLPVPSGLAGGGLSLGCFAVWVHPKCEVCGYRMHPTPGGMTCRNCFDGPDEPMKAEQLCALCFKPVPALVLGSAKHLLPYCSPQCQNEAAKRRAELDPETPPAAG